MSITTIAPITVDPTTGVREIKPTFPGGTQRFTTGRDAKGRFSKWDAVKVIVTPHGHWYRQDDVRDSNNDTTCRGCGHHGHYDYILDYEKCSRPATAEDVTVALSGPARHVQPGGRVRLTLPEYLEPVCGVIRSIYLDDGTEVADIDLDNGHALLRDMKLATAA